MVSLVGVIKGSVSQNARWNSEKKSILSKSISNNVLVILSIIQWRRDWRSVSWKYFWV